MGDSMSTIINATTTNGVVIQPDNSGSLVLQTNSGTTALTIDTSQRAAFVAGTAALPAITTTGDTNTGMFFPAADTIAFAEGGTEAMRLDSSGNVGIGNTAPNTRLHVQGGTNADGSLTYNQQLTSTAAFNASPATGTLVSLQFNSGGSYAGMGGWSVNKENATDGNFAGYMAFHTRANGGSTTERMRIDSSGNVLMGTTSTSSSTRGWKTLNSGSNTIIGENDTGNVDVFEFYRGTAGSLVRVGNIRTNGTNTTYTTSSDYRLKDNIAPIIGALDKVALLKPVTYTWKQDGSDGQGFIAHELQEVIPDCVTGEKDDVETYTDEDGIEQTRIKPQGIDTSFLVATLTAAIQEQQIIINDLKARVETLEAK
jgi:hypothetical protein